MCTRVCSCMCSRVSFCVCVYMRVCVCACRMCAPSAVCSSLARTVTAPGVSDNVFVIHTDETYYYRRAWIAPERADFTFAVMVRIPGTGPPGTDPGAGPLGGVDPGVRPLGGVDPGAGPPGEGLVPGRLHCAHKPLTADISCEV